MQIKGYSEKGDYETKLCTRSSSVSKEVRRRNLSDIITGSGLRVSQVLTWLLSIRPYTQPWYLSFVIPLSLFLWQFHMIFKTSYLCKLLFNIQISKNLFLKKWSANRLKNCTHNSLLSLAFAVVFIIIKPWWMKQLEHRNFYTDNKFLIATCKQILANKETLFLPLYEHFPCLLVSSSYLPWRFFWYSW